MASTRPLTWAAHRRHDVTPWADQRIVDVPTDFRKRSEDVRSLPEFGHLRHEIWALLRDEVLEAEQEERRKKLGLSRFGARSVSLGNLDVNADHALPFLASQPPLSRGVGLRGVTQRFWHIFRRSIAIVAFLTFWELAPRMGLAEPAFLPPLSEVLRTGAELVRNGQLFNHVQASLSRSLVGFGLAICTRSLWSRDRLVSPLQRVVSPLLEAFRNTAALALLPVFILVLGIGESSKIALVVYSCSFPILLNTIAGVKGVDPLLIKSARTMGLSPFRIFTR